MARKFIHPYIPNSVPEVQQEMLQEIGVKAIDEFYECIPVEQKVQGKLDLDFVKHQ